MVCILVGVEDSDSIASANTGAILSCDQYRSFQQDRRIIIMAANIQEKDFTGVLFPEKNKKGEASPDVSGTIRVEGKQYRIAGWKKTSRNGGAFYSLAISEPRATNTNANVTEDDF